MEPLEQVEFDAAPRCEWCERCGRGADGDLRFVVLRGRARSAGRTLCDLCAEEVLETMLATEPAVDAIPLLIEMAESALLNSEAVGEHARALCGQAEHQRRRARRAIDRARALIGSAEARRSAT
jgi:hypothetical protein